MATVIAVCRKASHGVRKEPQLFVRLVAGEGVEGDAHRGPTIQHRSRVKKDPSQPNLRQVHLVAAELHDELRAKGFVVGAGDMGENLCTRGVDLLALSEGARLRIGEASLEVTGLRNPCPQLDGLQEGLMAAVLDRDADGALIRRAGVMAVVLVGGIVRPGDGLVVEEPSERRSLRPV